MSPEPPKQLRITLPAKPGASLHVSLFPAEPASPAPNPLSNTLVVFLNGLLLPSAAWSETISRLVALRRASRLPAPFLLAYDRYGQGKSDPDPADPPGSDYGHGPLDAASDLQQLLERLVRDRHLPGPPGSLRLVLVGSSIGCALARLYASAFASAPAAASARPGLVAAYLFLDSIMANTDFVSIFPDPDGPGFDKRKLPRGVTPDDLRRARRRFRQYFHPEVPNNERLDRRGLRGLLPRADEPALPDGPGGKAPILTVVGHDGDEFAEQCERSSLGVSKAVINAYMNPAWARYNEGLTHLTSPPGELKVARDCGHFIQKDDPEFVANEISHVLDRVALL
ncbi:hypothetical protein VTJ83DRAFT_1334 [Remersonia thermophila]|uniref:AB hydrolase-1 domain-containing protein n=1 Tax=Remersonia thermophila TaxID=72144 RepID=A0ABR4DNQ9_9PEZI